MNKTPPNEIIPVGIVGENELLHLAQTYGTPLYVYDTTIIQAQWRRLQAFLPENVRTYYSVKANPNSEVIREFRRLGASFETVSAGELELVSSDQNDGVILVGPGKSDEELELAIENRAYIIVESPRELKRIQSICDRRGCRITVALRVNPGDGNGMIAMGGQTQFGMDRKTAIQLIHTASRFPNILIDGLHFYLGTGILDGQLLLDNTKIILSCAQEIVAKTGMSLAFLDIGGGLGIPYHRGEKDLCLPDIRDAFHALLHGLRRQHASLKVLAFESGRFLVGPSGIFLAKVVDIKTVLGKDYTILDGGTNVFALNTRYMGYKAFPMKVLADGYREDGVTTICGPLCTSSDRLSVDVHTKVAKVGDIVAFYQAGAYGYSASPGLFLSHGFPKEVMYGCKRSALTNYFEK